MHCGLAREIWYDIGRYVHTIVYKNKYLMSADVMLLLEKVLMISCLLFCSLFLGRVSLFLLFLFFCLVSFPGTLRSVERGIVDFRREMDLVDACIGMVMGILIAFPIAELFHE